MSDKIRRRAAKFTGGPFSVHADAWLVEALKSGIITSAFDVLRGANILQISQKGAPAETALPGDWLVLDPTGSIYVLSDAQFNADYAAIEDAPGTPSPELKPAQSIHPSPDEFTEAELVIDPILRFFHYKHLPDSLKVISMPFCHLARLIIDQTPRSAERTASLRKLLEAKDCAVRASLPTP